MPGWTRHENFVPDKTNRAFDLELMKTNKAKDVTRTIKQDKTRLDQQLKNASRDFKKRMNQINNETNKWKKKAEKLKESREYEGDVARPPSRQLLARRRGSLDSNLLLAQQQDFTRQRSKTMLSIDDLPGSGSPETGRRVQSGRYTARRGSLDPTVLSLRQKEFFSKIAKMSSSQTDVTRDGEGDNSKIDGDGESPPASPPPMSMSRPGRRGSLPAMHLGGQGSRPPAVGQMPPLELIQEIERRGSQNSGADKENDYLERMKLENEGQHSEHENKNSTEGSQNTTAKMLRRRSSISWKQSPRSLRDPNADRKKSPRPEPKHSKFKQVDEESISGSSRGQRSRSNSLYDPKSIRLTRRRNSTQVSEDLTDSPSLAEQFDQLKNCRYLRSRNSIQNEEDCDLSNVFG